ncbi:MAG: NAD-dependent deacylase [Nitrospira sp.]|nr:NAD-dependent deacylase [Nitrospira sp.]MDH4368845.1 NAD-dependent deacylase [Nitrospira sp.]MDH5496210.1 NAD-dependent deacylase [Nitrospira sp.]MDH5724105.1 NAD-dependent deacylase [Nitrospira sp.]
MTHGSDLGILKDKLANARSITVLTGAGISADSGVPTFRGTDGLWRNFRAEDLATPDAFTRDPRLVWEWYNWRRELIATKQPNAAHQAIVELERRCPRFWLITQNVDGLHRAAGSRRLSEIHGNIWMVRCTACGHVSESHEVPIQILPLCSLCRNLLRPHIVWFGESLAEEDLRRSYTALQSSDVCLIIGTSGMVYPAAGFASIAKEAGAFVAEINLDPTPQSALVDMSLQGRAKDIVPLLLEPC